MPSMIEYTLDFDLELMGAYVPATVTFNSDTETVQVSDLLCWPDGDEVCLFDLVATHKFNRWLEKEVITKYIEDWVEC